MRDLLPLIIPGGAGAYLVAAQADLPEWFGLLAIPTVLMAMMGGVGLIVDLFFEPPSERFKWRDAFGAAGFAGGLLVYAIVLFA